jgi:hypothetical protein
VSEGKREKAVGITRMVSSNVSCFQLWTKAPAKGVTCGLLVEMKKGFPVTRVPGVVSARRMTRMEKNKKVCLGYLKKIYIQ